MANTTISLPIPAFRRLSTKQSIAHAFRFPGKYTFQDSQGNNLGKLVDDYGYSPGGHNAKLWAIGHEYGFCHLVHCDNECEAWEAHIDESATIAPDELPEAYGFYLMQAKTWSAPDNGEPWYVLCDGNFHEDSIGQIVSEKVLKCTGDRRCIGEYVETDEYIDGQGFYRFNAAFATKGEALAFCLKFIQESELEVIEGYEYQSNSSGTGIVNSGYYGHMQEIDWNGLVVTRKA